MISSSIETILESVWDTRVKSLYKLGKIQTERHLQAYLFMWLKEELTKAPESDWDVWVEPQLYFKDKKTKSGEKMYKPDIIITKSTEIVGIIELKFSPQQYDIEKNLQAAMNDMDKLALYYNGLSNLPKSEQPLDMTDKCSNFFLELDPERGCYRRPAYQRTVDTIYAFLGIARYGATGGKQRLWEYLSEKLPHSNFMLKVSDSAFDFK